MPTTARQFAVWRDGVSVLNWTDSNAPHSSGSYIALRTNKSIVRFDNIRITGNPATNSTLYHLYGDHLGSTSVLADSSGQVVDKTYYLPFGEYRRGDSSILTESGFTGHLHNDPLGLIYMNARFYSPSSGRFISADTIIPDPANPQSFNRYSYTYNNPLRFTDPSGHNVDCAVGEFGCHTQSNNPYRIFYVPGLNGKPYTNAYDIVGGEYNAIFSSLESNFGKDNVELIPVFNKGEGREAMYAEAWGHEKPYANLIADFVESNLSFESGHPLAPNEKLVLVGSSAGGTTIIEALEILEERGIYVDQAVLRGSFVSETSLNNIGQVDYIAPETPILSDFWNYSVDINPFDGVSVRQHTLTGFYGHRPADAGARRNEVQQQMAELVVDLIRD